MPSPNRRTVFALRPLGQALRAMAATQLVLGAALCVGAVGTAAAQAATSEYQVAPGPLADALNEFAQQAGVAIVMDDAQVAGRRSQGLQGAHGIADGFARLLEGSGLQLVDRGNGDYSLRTQDGAMTRAPDSATLLPAVKVQATAETDVTERSGSLTTQGPVSAATGLGLTLRETPQSLTVITRERIEQQNLNSVAEVAAQVTGVFFNSSGTPIGGRSLLYSRGYAIDSYQVDGVNLPWEALAESEQYGHGGLDTAIYDSVTVVRGSTGLMTGAGEPSALMALTRKKPTRELQTSLEATVGRWNRQRLMADVSSPLNASGSVRGRLVGAYDDGKTWVDDYSSDRSILYGALDVDLSPRTLLTLTLERGTADSEQAPWAFDYGVYFYFDDDVTPIPASTTTNTSAPWAYLNSSRTFASATLAQEFGDDWTARLSYGFGKFNTDMRRGMVRSIPEDGSRTTARVLSLDYHYDTHVVDARIDGNYQLFGREHELVAGMNLYRTDQAAPLAYYDDTEDLAYWSNGQLLYDTPDWNAVPGSEGDYPYDIETEQDGFYLATRLRPMDRLSVILGGRLSNWTRFEAERETARNSFFVYDDRKYTDELTPYAGVVFDLAQALSVYTSYTHIFQPQTERDVAGRVLDPVDGNTYEIGLKGAWFQGRLNASVAAFESRRDNVAAPLPIFDEQGNQLFEAKDHTKGRGWDLEVSGALTPRWQIQAGYSISRTRTVRAWTSTSRSRSSSSSSTPRTSRR